MHVWPIGVGRFLFVPLLAAAACSGGSISPDGGGTSGSGGGAGGSTGGGPVNTCNLGGVGGSRATGTGGRSSCVADAVGCELSDPINGAPPTGTCAVENSACVGHSCYNQGKIDEYGGPWAVLCCGGKWLPAQPYLIPSAANPPACPTLVRPGDHFPCGDAGLTCFAGQSACVENVDPATAVSHYACAPLCSAGDCSCFCPSTEECTFICQQSGTCPLDPSDQACPADRCTCGLGFDTLGVTHQPGTVQLVCTR